MKRPPKLIEMAALAKKARWSTKRVRRVLIKSKLVSKIGGRWVTTRARLRESDEGRLLLEVLDE